MYGCGYIVLLCDMCYVHKSYHKDVPWQHRCRRFHLKVSKYVKITKSIMHLPTLSCLYLLFCLHFPPILLFHIQTDNDAVMSHCSHVLVVVTCNLFFRAPLWAAQVGPKPQQLPKPVINPFQLFIATGHLLFISCNMAEDVLKMEELEECWS